MSHHGYVPVEPDTGVVHDNGDDIDRTQCGKVLTWVKNVLLIAKDAPLCQTCYPDTCPPEEG